MQLLAKQRLMLTALNFNKLPLHDSPPEDFEEKFLKKFSGSEGVTKLWILRRAMRSYMKEPHYKEWMELFDKLAKEMK